MPHDDTIVAISSPPGRSPRGLIRISGPAAPEILLALAGSLSPDRSLTACRLCSPLSLPVLLTHFTGPRSYTGQHLAEIQLPGNPALLDRVLHAILNLGARQAEPGEFTFRAYLAGKLDLTQAEGIAATIAAVSDSQLQAAALLREGRLGRFAARLVDLVGTQLALVEAGIDFTDQDDVVPIAPARLDANLAAAEATLDDLLSHSRAWGAIEGLPRVVLVGQPSTGKSTLFNALLGRRRAVISERPGTTRDVLAEPLTLPGESGAAVEVMLVDIAGLDRPRTLIDERMQAVARLAIESADLLLLISDKASGGFALPLRLPASIPRLEIQTKSDLDEGASSPTSSALSVSAHTGRNLDLLRARIAGHIGSRAVSIAADMLALQPRHESALREARARLAAARALLAPHRDGHAIADVELVAGELRAALDHLAALGGALTPDDVIGRVFATFCVGK
jgi:tRNA modification GTPase